MTLCKISDTDAQISAWTADGQAQTPFSLNMNAMIEVITSLFFFINKTI